MKKIKKIIALIMALVFGISTCLGSSTFATSYVSPTNSTKISGYKGNIVLTQGPYIGGLLERSCGFYIEVKSSVNGEDISKLHVTWSSSDSKVISVENWGYDKNSHCFEAYLTVMQYGTHPVDVEGNNPIISATVNGVKLSEEFIIPPETAEVEDPYSYKKLKGDTSEISVGRICLSLDKGGLEDPYKKGVTFNARIIKGGPKYNNIPGLNVTWSFNDPSMFSITDLGYHAGERDDDDYYAAKVTILKDGTHNDRKDVGNPIFYATVNGIQLGDEVYVEPAPVKATSVTLTHKAVALNGKGKSARVAFFVNPENVPLVGKDRYPTVLSYNYKIAKLTDLSGQGFEVTAVSNGTVTIAVQTPSGVKGTCIVTVTGC
jgi:uncharacterized protein YjdB